MDEQIFDRKIHKPPVSIKRIYVFQKNHRNRLEITRIIYYGNKHTMQTQE